ncbi:MAG: ABC transporter permease [Acidimicrobiaceae bacterium]|nr:ABC transporter permease [Acidimicrobiaceae bacterium]MXY12200.1 ABC transporter permease [Acidimicrobiaceae bacterium]MXZ63939.1 ABC transporter permease [Acidimicrobiaceae bacterium]MYF33456.1 ABC transporter permease [Acidimicrobiaceae bacterium]MYG79181.1 ABC transporter permease [Acidimicrobiaceae bacterium]
MHFVRVTGQRTALAVVALFAVSLITFWAVELLPGDAATRMLGREATPERVANFREQMNLNAPAVERYTTWISGFVQGDWGESLVQARPKTEGAPAGRINRSVTDIIVPRLTNTLELAAFALVMYVPLSLAIGIVTAVYRDRTFAAGLSTLVILGCAVPDFVIAIFLLVIFAVTLEWFPPLSLVDQAESFGAQLRMMTLPAVTLTAAMTGFAVRQMQASLLSVLNSDYVQFATLKGLPRRRVLLLHALPNALGPALRATVINVVWLVGGVVLVEVVFTYPGIGLLLLDALRLLDTPVILASTMILAGVYVLCNLGADLVAAALNPRLRTG